MSEKYKNIVVVAVDRSEHAQNAFQFYLEHMNKPEHNVVLLHCPEQGRVSKRMERGEMAAYTEEYWQEVLEKKKLKWKAFGELCEQMLKDANAQGTFLVEQTSEPGAIICRVAKNKRAQMIVMGTRGLGTVRRTLMGSVSDYVLHNAPCAVSIYRGFDQFKGKTRSGSLLLGEQRSRSSSGVSDEPKAVTKPRSHSSVAFEDDELQKGKARSGSFTFRDKKGNKKGSSTSLDNRGKQKGSSSSLVIDGKKKSSAASLSDKENKKGSNVSLARSSSSSMGEKSQKKGEDNASYTNSYEEQLAKEKTKTPESAAFVSTWL